MTLKIKNNCKLFDLHLKIETRCSAHGRIINEDRKDGHRDQEGIRGTCPQDFAVNKEVPFSFLENASIFLRGKVPSRCRAPKFEMLPTVLIGNLKK